MVRSAHDDVPGRHLETAPPAVQTGLATAEVAVEPVDAARRNADLEDDVDAEFSNTVRQTQRVLIEFQNFRHGHARDTEQGSPPQEPLVNTHGRGHFIDQVRVLTKVGQLIVRQI